MSANSAPPSKRPNEDLFTPARLVGNSVLEEEVSSPAVDGDIDDEIEMVRDQLMATQGKLKLALVRYEELYRYSEDLVKNSEQREKDLSEKIAQLEASVGGAKTETLSASTRIEEFQALLIAKDVEIRNLKSRESTLLGGSNKISRVIGKNIQSLEDLSSFIEGFILRFETSDSHPLVPQGTRIILEQLKSEIEELKTVRTHISQG